MSGPEDLIDFDIIENQKENIQSLPGGRSARNLANLFSSPLHKLATPTPTDTKNINDVARQEYESELETIAESDDPLDIYNRYVRWTLEAYPSAQATPASQLLPLLERATKAFLNSTQYKNDPRYLKLWLYYIRFFSDTPRETFAFLARHSIGDALALFYEEFAAWLENAGRWFQAEEVYKMGIDREARPVPRLVRKFNEFQQRFSQRPEDNGEPASPALPTVRPALGVKIDPFASAGSHDPQAPRPNSGVGGTTSKSGRQKLAIFSDTDDAAAAVSSAAHGAEGWQNIGSIADQKKENTVAATPWVGETLKAGGKKSSTKMAVFKDECPVLPHISNPHIDHPTNQQVTTNLRNGRSERVCINLMDIYPDPNDDTVELSLEELQAARRGWLSKVWTLENATGRFSIDKPLLQESPDTDILSREVAEKLVIARDPIMVDENGQRIESRPGKSKKMKIKEVNETQIIKAKLSSPSGKKMTKRKSTKEVTMTLHTKAATDEIYEMFSQPLKDAKGIETEGEEDDEDSESDDGDTTDGDYTSGGESTGTGRLMTSEAGDDETSEVKSVSEWSEFTARKHIPNMDDDDDEDDENESELNDTQQSTFSEEEEDDFEAIELPPNRGQELEQMPPTRTMYVPIPPEDFVAPRHPFRDAAQVSQNRLPFMTPIVEKTESSIGLTTARHQKEYLISKTPSKANASTGKYMQSIADNEESSPFRDVNEDARPSEKISQPLLGKPNGTAMSVKTQPSTHPLARDIMPKGPIIKDAQCNPVDDFIRSMIFENLQPPLSSYEGFHGHQDEVSGRTAELKKFAKAMTKLSKNASDKTTTNITMPPLLQFSDTERQYSVKRELGAGAFAPVYLIENVTDEDTNDQVAGVMGKGTFDYLGRTNLEALKMEDPPTAWEFYIMRQAKRRLGVSRAADSVINVFEMHLYKDECFLIEEFREQGTLLDIINIARADSTVPGGVMDETLAMFFAVELLRTVEALHAKGILHGDLKADNCLVRLNPIPDADVWRPRYTSDGSGGWSQKGIALIDFGRGIDMKVFKPDVQFIADWKTGPADCAEMRDLRPWTYQIDYHGLAGIIHSMLFGKYIDTVAERGSGIGAAARSRWRVKESLKRYWQTELWGGLFDLLLNPCLNMEGEEGQKLPVLRGMKGVRKGMEEWLEGNSERGTGLQGGIRKLEHALSRRK